MLIGCLIGITLGAALVNAAFYLGPLRVLLDAFRQNSTAPTSPRAAAPVSVVIAARDEAANLSACLPEVLAQAYRSDWEVVVVDDASTDASAAVLERLTAGHAELRTLRISHKQRPGKKAALAAGIAAARHDWLLSTDADCQPGSREWISTMMSVREPATEIVLGYAPYGKTAGALNAWTRFEAVYTAMQYFAAALLGRAYMGVGRNLLYTRALYERLGGFAAHAHLAGGDDDLLVNAGATPTNVAVCLAPQAWMYSAAETTWAAYLHQKRRHLRVGRVYRNRDQWWLGLLGGSHAVCYAGLLVGIGVGAGWAALAIYMLRAVVVAPRVTRGMRELGLGELQWAWPLFDFGLAAYYAFGAFAVLGRPSQEWRRSGSTR